MTTTRIRDTVGPLLRSAVLDAAAVVLPVRCGGCDRPDRALCPRCERSLAPDVRLTVIGSLRVWSAIPYEGTPRRILLAFKESGRVDAASALARALRPAVAEAQRATKAALPVDRTNPRSGRPALLPVLIPSTRAAWRRRGYHPTGLVLSRSRSLVPPLWRALRLSRQTVDQVGLTGAARVENRAGSMQASPRLRGRPCVLIDDILTTGATLSEAARAIQDVGGQVVGAVTIARTPLRRQ